MWQRLGHLFCSYSCYPVKRQSLLHHTTKFAISLFGFVKELPNLNMSSAPIISSPESKAHG